MKDGLDPLSRQHVAGMYKVDCMIFLEEIHKKLSKMYFCKIKLIYALKNKVFFFPKEDFCFYLFSPTSSVGNPWSTTVATGMPHSRPGILLASTRTCSGHVLHLQMSASGLSLSLE